MIDDERSVSLRRMNFIAGRKPGWLLSEDDYFLVQILLEEGSDDDELAKDDSHTLEFTLGKGSGFQTSGVQAMGRSILWTSALYLSRWLANSRNVFKDKVVIELGCGLALPSFVCDELGAKRVLATDYNSKILKNVEANCKRNKAGNVHAMPLDFTRLAQVARVQADVVLFSDIIYNDHLAKIVPPCLYLMLKNSRCKAYAVLPTAYRGPCLSLFFEALEKYKVSVARSDLEPAIVEGTTNDVLKCKLFAFTLQEYGDEGVDDEEEEGEEEMCAGFSSMFE